MLKAVKEYSKIKNKKITGTYFLKEKRLEYKQTE